MFGLDWGEMFKAGLALTLLIEAPGEYRELKDHLNSGENLVCYSFVDNSIHVVEENVRELYYNPSDRSWSFIKDGERYRRAVADTATCHAEEAQ